MKPESWIDGKLAALLEQHQLRRATAQTVERRLNFASNDYLDLACRPALTRAANEATSRYGAGSRASRLVSGTLDIHEAAERVVADAKGYPAALLFGSGYLASIGVIPALVGRGDVIFADRLCHACLLDGIQLSGAKLQRFRHNDARDLRQRLARTGASGRKLIITESVFSMDGDIAPLPDIAQLASEVDAMLMVDEAHATGVFGPLGKGRVAELQLQSHVNVAMSTFSKAMGVYGGAVACSVPMRDWLINKARSFIFTTAPPPSICGAVMESFNILAAEPDLGTTVLARSAAFRTMLAERGFSTSQSASPIVPVIIGDNAMTMAIAGALGKQGIQVGAIRPPTVPAGTARLRFSVTLASELSDLEYAADALVRAAQECGWKA